MNQQKYKLIQHSNEIQNSASRFNNINERIKKSNRNTNRRIQISFDNSEEINQIKQSGQMIG